MDVFLVLGLREIVEGAFVWVSELEMNKTSAGYKLCMEDDKKNSQSF